MGDIFRKSGKSDISEWVSLCSVHHFELMDNGGLLLFFLFSSSFFSPLFSSFFYLCHNTLAVFCL